MSLVYKLGAGSDRGLNLSAVLGCNQEGLSFCHIIRDQGMGSACHTACGGDKRRCLPQ